MKRSGCWAILTADVVDGAGNIVPLAPAAVAVDKHIDPLRMAVKPASGKNSKGLTVLSGRAPKIHAASFTPGSGWVYRRLWVVPLKCCIGRGGQERVGQWPGRTGPDTATNKLADNQRPAFLAAVGSLVWNGRSGRDFRAGAEARPAFAFPVCGA